MNPGRKIAWAGHGRRLGVGRQQARYNLGLLSDFSEMYIYVCTAMQYRYLHQYYLSHVSMCPYMCVY